MAEGTIERTLSRVSLRMARSLDLGAVLSEIARGLTDDLGAALARIWLTGPGDACSTCFLARQCRDRTRCLHLVASAGLSDRLDGSHRRIPLGVLKVGGIAAGREAVCTNSLLDDPRIMDKAWVRREGLAAFAGYPLAFGREVFGVLAMFARRPLTDLEFEQLGIFAAQASVAIQNARLFEAVSRLSQQLQTENSYLKEELRAVIANSDVVVFEQDAELRYRWIYNAQLFKAEEVVGKTDAELFPLDTAARLTAVKRRVLESGQGTRDELRVTRDGETRLYQLDLHPFRDETGTIVGVTGVSTDITQERRAREELARALEFREQVMGILGHDLRNPLSAVSTLTTLLLRKEDLPPRVRQKLSDIDRAGKRMLELIGTLLDFSESRFAGRLPISPVCSDVHTISRAVVDELLAANPGRSIELTLDGDGGGTFDPARLTQVLSNLVGNALKHGAQEAPVRVRVVGDDDEVVVTVHNRGEPIPPALVPKLFEPFRRGTTRGDGTVSRGLGLGLYIARHIVNAHGGTLAVESTAEQGTTFTMRLPRATDVACEERSAHGARAVG